MVDTPLFEVMTYTVQDPMNGQALFTSSFGKEQGDSNSRLRFGAKENEIDDFVLGGGLERGIVVGLSAGGAVQDGVEVHVGRVLIISLLTSVLLKHTEAKLLIVDSTGSFPVVQLQKALTYRLEETNRDSKKTKFKVHTAQDEVEKTVRACLQRVEIARVFNIEGLWEVLREVDSAGEADGMDFNEEREELPDEDFEDLLADGEDGEISRVREALPEIMDSEAESSDFENSSTPPRQPLQSQKGEPNQVQGSTWTPNHDSQRSRTELVVVDNITSLITELFSRIDREEAHKTLTTLTKILQTQSNDKGLTILLLNTLTKSSNTKTSPINLGGIFSSPNIPSLGKLFSHIPMLHLFVSAMPQGPEDADLAYGGVEEEEEEEEEDGRAGTKRMDPARVPGVRCVQTLEVLKDRCPFKPQRQFSSDLESNWEETWGSLQSAKSRIGINNREQRFCVFKVVFDAAWLGVGIKDAAVRG